VHRIWERIEADFPRQHNRLLAFVNADWFGHKGWLASTSTDFERRVIGRALKQVGALARPFQQELDALAKAKASDPRWLELCVKSAELASSLKQVRQLRRAAVALADGFPDDYPRDRTLARVADYEQRLLTQARSLPDRKMLDELEQLRRDLLVRENPLLKGQRLLFVKRLTYNSSHYYDDYYNGLRNGPGFGGNIYELDLATGRGRRVVPQFEGGVFDRFDLSFDAKRIAFGYRRPKAEGYRIHEIGVDGRGLRQLTFPPADEDERIAKYSYLPRAALDANPQSYGHWTDDLHPCYLPDGRIAFVSTRAEHSVLCGGHSLTATSLYRIDGDGSNLHQISQGSLSEFSPTVMNDGRILYNRWEYVYKGIAAIQPLWALRPDGSASEEIYGDNIANPGVFVHARQVPGRDHLVVATGCGHEPLAVGTIVLVDMHKSKRTKEAMTYLTPDTDVRGLRGLYQRRNGQWRAHDVYGPFYCDPYPLADPKTYAGAGQFFLVACNPRSRYNDKSAYGIYLLDTFGNCVLVHEDDEFSCWQPMLLQPRRKPPALPEVAEVEPSAAVPQLASCLVTDVYQGLDGVPRGTVKYLRVMEQIARPWSVHCGYNPKDRWPGQMVAISYYTHIWIAVLHGIVPVHEDGSAHFTVPADRNVYFQALDKDFMEVQKMRTFVNFQPEEKRSCIGCHEHRVLAPPTARPAAMGLLPVPPRPQPGEAAPRPLHYPTDVQPIFDKHCVSCHGGSKPKADLDLSGETTDYFSRSYEQLITKGFVPFIQEWTGPRMKSPPQYFTVGGSMAHAPAAAPYTYGSHKCKLVAHLRKGHHNVKLSREEWIKLVTWIDCNAPFYGSYFGRRHKNFHQRPGFRACPTLESACGAKPAPVRAKPVPATLAAWWKLGKTASGVVADASGNGHEARAVGTVKAEGRPALRFDGKSYLEAGDLGQVEAASITMWVKADSLGSRWNPLLFANDPTVGSVHYSLLSSGVPNVAVHSGDWQWTHRAAKTSLADQSWHHLVLVCDARFGGSVRFYVDGKLDNEGELDLGHPLEFARFRIGAWSSWAGRPQNNFHGEIADVRIYQGMLTEEAVAKLAAEGR